ncbi:MAG: type II toxin-antitoxin system HicB family antitoxin [Oscillatoria sp. PMC 1068.18]|nr:type II toxin-antitoxin system HicB family antitoxin [Oscillatoria sp. PMC 1076.18]MEC4990469.1 type II toxin-antitoxin system HicB family antitoxin [Oscillatoria sp. PMC 1068.18]
MKIKVVVWQEDGVWCGSVPGLPGCHTWGESYEQLIEMLQEAIEGWLEVASEQQSLNDEQKLVEISL